MAKETARKFDHEQGAIVVTIEDDFGREEHHTIYVAHHLDKCPSCGAHIPRDAQGKVDINTIVAERLKDAELRADTLIDMFERHGADVEAVKARRAARRWTGPKPEAAA